MTQFTALRSVSPSAHSEPNQAPSARLDPEDSSFFGRLQRQALLLYMKWCDDWWMLDILGVALSCVLTAVLWVLLVVFDGRQLQDFDSIFGTDIRPNTIVSLLTTTSVASSMMVVQDCISQLKWHWYRSTRPLTDFETYDRASRGTVGSVMLLYNLNVRSLASIGALLTIVHLAMSPLAQQAVKPLPRPVHAGSGAAPVTYDWTVPAGSNNRFVAGGYSRIRASMKGAMTGGLFFPQEQHLPDVAPECGTGNCTFHSYTSLAVCSSVADVTQNLTKRAQPSQGQGFPSWCLPQGACVNNNGTPPYPTVANISSAAGPSAHVQWLPNGAPFKMLEYESIAFRDRVSPIADFYLIYMNTTHPEYDSAHPASAIQYNALEFVLDWCVPTFSTNVSNGFATTMRAPRPRLDFTKPSKLADNSQEAPIALDAYPLSLTAEGQNYTINQGTHATLQRYVASALEGEIVIGGDAWQITTTWSDGAQAIWTATQQDNDELFQRGINQAKTQAQAIDTLETALNNTAVSMSNNVRLVSKQTVSGYMEADQIIVEFEWGYLAAITAFTAAAVFFFIAVLTFARPPRGQPVWKSSTNAVLRVLGPQLQESLGGAKHAAPMADDAEFHSAELDNESDSWRLVESPSHTDQKEGTNGSA